MSATTILFRGKRLKLDDALLLGQGGEARVYRHPTLDDLALKIYHPPDPAQPAHGAHARIAHAKIARLRSEKLQRLCALSRALPALVIVPREIVTDAGGALVGYAMTRVIDAVDIAALARKGAERAALADATAILGIFRALAEALDALHAQDVFAGDLNDGNVVLSNGSSARSPLLIDVDSAQIGRASQAGALPCPVAHERFLDPRLYGKALLDDACFDEASDAFALRVLLFQSLLCIHPYGGVHTKYPTLLRRAEAGHSILRGDVQLPRAAIPFSTLSDDLLDEFSRCFDQGERKPTLAPALFDVRFRACACGVEHARASCPACKVAVQAPAIRTRGGVSEETVVETRGLVLLARAFDGQLAYLVEEGGRVRREDHATVFTGPRSPGMRFEIAGDATWIGRSTSLVKVRHEQVVDRASTACVRGVPAFAAGRAGLFVVEGDALVHHESRVRVGRVLEDQTALLSSDAGGLGLYRAGRLLLSFLFGGAPASRGLASDGFAFVDATLPQPKGKLVDLDVAFGDDGRALVGFATDENGKRIHTLALLDARGRLVASVEGEPERELILQSVRGKCIAGDRILSTSSEGICAVDVDVAASRLRSGAVFTDTQPFVDASVEILPGAGGTLLVKSPQTITRLRLRP